MTPVGITHLKAVLIFGAMSFAGLFTTESAAFAVALLASFFAALFIIMVEMGDHSE